MVLITIISIFEQFVSIFANDGQWSLVKEIRVLYEFATLAAQVKTTTSPVFLFLSFIENSQTSNFIAQINRKKIRHFGFHFQV